MNPARRRRAARASVFAASLAVVASLLVAPAAQAEETTAAVPTAAEDPAPTDAPTPAEESSPAPTSAPTTTTEAGPTADVPVDTGDTVVGELVQAWPDPVADEVLDAGHEEEHADEGPLSWIQPAEGDAVRVPTEDLPTAPVGSTVAVTVGEETSDEASEEQGFDEAREVLDAQVLEAAAPDPTTAAAGAAPTNTVTVVLVVPAGGTADSTTVSSVVNQVDGGVAAYWSSQSNDTIRLDAVAGAPGWISSPRACSDAVGLWNDVAARIGWTNDPGQHLLLYLPRTSTSCSYGLGSVGSSPGSGGVSYVRDVATSVMAHELGHNFGLGHSSQYQCDGALETGTCQTRAYYDLYDVMGISWGQIGSLNAPQAARLGLLPTSATASSTPQSATSTISLAPVSAASGTRAVRLTDAEGTVYWLEYRRASGQDAWLGDGRNSYGLDSGVFLRRAAGSPNTSLLLDATPSPAARWSGDLQSALRVGTTVTVSGRDFAVTVQAVSATAATVQVVPSPPAPAAPPTGSSVFYLNDGFTGAATTVYSYGEARDVVYVGDWDGDGKDTVMLRRGNTFFVRNSNTTGAADTSFTYGDPGDVVLVGDWDGDGTDTLTVRRGNAFYVKNSTSSGVADLVFSYGDRGDVVLVGDWDGDDVDTLAVRRGALFLVKNTTTSGVADRSFTYGDPGDEVHVGRWSANQTGDTLAVRRGITYFLRYSVTSGPADLTFAYGNATDVPLVGDWNADGLDTIGVRRTAG